VSYVQLVYGRQLQRPVDEVQADDPLDVSRMSREQRDALKRRLLAQHPELVDELKPVYAGPYPRRFREPCAGPLDLGLFSLTRLRQKA